MQGFRPSVLAVDDNSEFLHELKTALAPNFEVKTAVGVQAAMMALAKYRPDLILLDMNMPDISGLEFLKILRQRAQTTPVIMLTGQTDPDCIVNAMKAGASDYVVKNSEEFIEGLKIRIQQALQLKNLSQENLALNRKLYEFNKRYEILGVSPSTLRLRAEIPRYKGTNAFVLILGENGTGKELVARNLNFQEGAKRPFVAVNCGAIPSTLFESELFGHVKGAFTGAVVDQVGKFVMADGGDIFLDEIGELPLDMQVKLLRVLQEKTVTPVGSRKTIQIDVRVIAATNKNLEDLVQAGKFREDLYFRLNRIVISTAPLRERDGDVLYLAERFAQNESPGIRISAEAKLMLANHTWPGNVRELHNTIERGCLLARGAGLNRILPEHLKLSSLRPMGTDLRIPNGLIPTHTDELTASRFQEALDWMERRFLEAGLALLRGDNFSLISKLGLSKSHYYRRKKALEMNEEAGA